MLPSDYQVPVLDYDLELTGTLTAFQGSALPQSNMLGYTWINVQITGTWVGTIAFQTSNDGTNWNAAVLMAVGTSAGVGVTTTTANGQWHGPLTGKFFRVYAAAWTSGTATATAVVSSLATSLPSIGGQVSVTSNQLIGPNPTISTVGLTLTAGTTYSQTYNGALTLVKGSAARLYEYEFENPTASDVWFQLHNSATTAAVTLGTTVPVRSIRVPANTQRDWASIFSPSFANGLVIAATTTRAGATVATGPFGYYVGTV